MYFTLHCVMFMQSFLSKIFQSTVTSVVIDFRKRDEQLKDELRRASEEKEPLLRRGSAKDEKSPRGRRESSTSSDKVHMEEPMGPSICPDSVFQTLVTSTS